jgi:hypothetical protein
MLGKILILILSITAIILLHTSLPNHIKGQELGLNAIINAFSSWEFSRHSGLSEALVISITGPTGTCLQ